MNLDLPDLQLTLQSFNSYLLLNMWSIRVLFLLIAVGNPIAGNKAKSGITFPSLNEDGKFNRIVGGVEADPHEFPFIVSLVIDGFNSCGGSLIGPGVVLTAAHCVDGAGIVAVTFGAHDKEHYEQTQFTIPTREIVMHEAYDATVVANDIALLKLPKLVEIDGQNVDIAGLAQTESAVGSTLTTAGWGRTSDGSTQGSDVLQKVDIVVVDDQEAIDAYGNEIDFTSIICTSGTSMQGTCSGDSGGPMFSADGQLIGITSFGSSAGCEAGYPNCFTSVPNYIDWINSHI